MAAFFGPPTANREDFKETSKDFLASHRQHTKMAVQPHMRQQVETVLTRLRQHLAADGCDIQLLDVNEDGTVVLQMSGGAAGCVLSRMALKAGLESALKQAVPGVTRLEFRK